MDSCVPHYVIQGGAPLHGEVTLSGAKNAVTKMIMASLLTEEPCTLQNIPLIGDLYLTVELCRHIGSQVHMQDHTLTISTPTANCPLVSTEVGGLNRMVVMTIGPLLHRCAEADIPAPGGDRIGPRPINFHIDGLRQMGAEIVEQEGRYHCTSSHGLQGIRFLGESCADHRPSSQALETDVHPGFMTDWQQSFTVL